MALVSENLKSCGIKISASIGGVPSIGSGIVYVTPNFCDYNYVLTAKHIFQEDSQTPYDSSQILNIQLFYSELKELKKLQYIKKEEVKNRLIVFEKDFLIILINKTDDIPFNQILVGENLEDSDTDFFSWGVFSANEEQIHKFMFKRNDPSIKRFEMTSKIEESYLSGMSGAGVFIDGKNILYGIINS